MINYNPNYWQIFLEYIFWLRVPIVCGLTLFIFPILAQTLGANLIGNLFVMRGRWQLIAVMLSSTMAALTISFVSESILENAHARFAELFSNLPVFYISTGYQYCIALILLVPIWTITIWSSSESEFVSEESNLSKSKNKLSIEVNKFVIKEKKLVSGFLFGLLVSFLFGVIVFYSGEKLRIILDSHPFWENTIANIINYLTFGHSQGYLYDNKIAEEHLLGLALGILSLVVYLVVRYLFKPGIHHVSIIQKIIQNREAPALMYVLFLIWIITGVGGGLTFYLDLFSVPAIVFLIGISALGYLVLNVDHYFKLETKDIKASNETKEQNHSEQFKTAIEKRLENSNQPEDNRTLVVVAASGGGIQASGWTAQVLGGLQIRLGSSFTQAIGLISSVSGGAVGTMYFLDRFDSVQGAPQDSDLNKIFSYATEDWLDAVGWGVAYADLLRLTGWLSVFVNKYNDRGYALEDDWKIKMKFPEITLGDWQNKTLKGKIPIPVFNATLVEDGRRFLISPMKFVKEQIQDLINANGDRKVLDFRTLYKGYDLKVTTAARLSATFPYVSPVPRNDRENCIDLSNEEKFYGNYHIADGGYFDNSGLFSALEWIDSGLSPNSYLQGLGIKRIILLEINASPESKFKKGDKGRKWFTQLIGPLKTAYAVRDSTLISRNFKEIELLKEKWEGKDEDCKVDIHHVPIYFPEGYDQPLSWRLTQKQKKNLQKAWKDVQAQNAHIFTDLENLFSKNQAEETKFELLD